MHLPTLTRVLSVVVALAPALLPPQAQAQAAEPAASSPIAFTPGSPTPPPDVARSREAREFQEVADLAYAATQAFDRGDDQDGRRKAALAVARLLMFEQAQRQRGQAKAAGHFAMQRGRILMEMLDDPVAASEAYADAVVDDATNAEAPLALHQVLERARERGLLDQSANTPNQEGQP